MKIDEAIEMRRNTYNEAYKKGRQDTLKAVGEWLDIKSNKLNVSIKDIETLKQGEMPKWHRSN